MFQTIYCRIALTHSIVHRLGIAASHWRFRRAFVAQGKDIKELPFKARLYPFGPIFAFAVCLFVLVGQGYDSWMADPVVAADIIACYIGIPIVLAFYIGYKLVKRSKVVPLMEVDLDSGREGLSGDSDEKDRHDPLEGVSILKPATWKRIPSNLRSWRDAMHT